MTDSGQVVVRCDGATYFVEPHGELSFGRQQRGNDVVVGSSQQEQVEDTLISRLAGVLLFSPTSMAVRNRSAYHPIEVELTDQPGRLRTVEAGDELRLRLAPLSVFVTGSIRRYGLEVQPQKSPLGRGPGPADDGFGVDATVAATEGPLRLSPERRLDLAALCGPLLRPGRGRAGRPRAAPYADAAERRGISRKAMEKRIEHLVADVRDTWTVPGLEPGADVKQVLCDYAVRTGSVGVADLALLDALRETD